MYGMRSIWMYMVAFYEEMGWFLEFWFDSDPTNISFLHKDDTVKNKHDASLWNCGLELSISWWFLPSSCFSPFLLCGRGGWSKPVTPYKPQRQDKKQLPQAAQKFMSAWQRHARCHGVFENIPVVMRTLFPVKKYMIELDSVFVFCFLRVCVLFVLVRVCECVCVCALFPLFKMRKCLFFGI